MEHVRRKNMYKNLGCANGWSPIVWTRPNGEKFVEKTDTTPEEFKMCNHACREVKKGNCWYQVYCDVCKITWDYDCSG